jgi:hypothetical protein
MNNEQVTNSNEQGTENNEQLVNSNEQVALYSLIPLADFKAILGIDDRDTALSRYCLTTATFTIEQYCNRRFLCKKQTDYLTFAGEYVFSLREYPVCKVLSAHAATTALQGELLFGPENLVDPKHYYCLPDEGLMENIPFSLVLRPPMRLPREEKAIKVRYVAGYSTGKAPADLASACLELAAWNMNRYRGRRIGMTGKGEQFEASMPENVRLLLEPYRRKTI